MTRAWSSAATGACLPVPNGQESVPAFTSGAEYKSHSAKNVGRRCVTAIPYQSNTRSATQWSRAAWLLAFSRAEICDILTMASIPASLAAWAK